ncbi:MBL fold metallo-hydrolase [Oceanithermus sp.]
MEIRSLELGPLEARAYLVWREPARAVLLDPGAEPEKLLAWVEGFAVELEAVLLTHAHFDHVGAVAAVVEKRHLPVYLHPRALPVYRRAAASAARWGFAIPQPPEEPLVALEEGSLNLGPGFTVLHLPGHCPGHVAFYQPEAGTVFSGDVLFAGGVGRWDIPSADREELVASINKLFGLPDETIVYPGHGPETTLAAERETNRYVRQWLAAPS